MSNTTRDGSTARSGTARLDPRPRLFRGVTALLACAAVTVPPQTAVATDSSPATGEAVPGLPRRWLRTEGGYVLEVRRVASDGQLQAAHCNQRPIHAARGEWTRKDGKLGILGELHGVDYSGSKYFLQCVPGRG
jgi:hypothetical protein